MLIKSHLTSRWFGNNALLTAMMSIKAPHSLQELVNLATKVLFFCLTDNQKLKYLIYDHIVKYSVGQNSNNLWENNRICELYGIK